MAIRVWTEDELQKINALTGLFFRGCEVSNASFIEAVSAATTFLLRMKLDEPQNGDLCRLMHGALLSLVETIESGKVGVFVPGDPSETDVKMPSGGSVGAVS